MLPLRTRFILVTKSWLIKGLDGSLLSLMGSFNLVHAAQCQAAGSGHSLYQQPCTTLSNAGLCQDLLDRSCCSNKLQAP